MTAWRHALATGLLAVAAAAAAQTVRPGSSLPDALKDVKPAGGACRAVDYAAPGTPPARTAEEREPDLSCLLPVDRWTALAADPRAMLVDVRSAVEREQGGLEGALPLSAAEVGGKPFLKDKTLVLVGSGRGERELYVACAGLKARGFRDVRVLQGGVPAWQAAGRPLLARSAVPDETPRLTAAQLWGESHFEANLVLLQAGQSGLRSGLPQGRQVADLRPATLQAAVAAQRGSGKKQRPVAALVLVVAPDTPAAALADLRQALAPLPLLVYADGVAAFTARMREQQQVWAAQARGPRQPACGT